MDESLKVHLQEIACHVVELCPILAKHYRLKEKRLDNKAQAAKSASKLKKCLYCYSPFRPDNHRVRLLPRMALTRKVQKLLQRHSEDPRSLGKFQSKLVNDYVDGRNRWAVTCFSCKKTMKIPGQSRAERYEQMQARVQTKVVIEVKPKTKKEKLKEKKKMKKKKNKKNKSQPGDVDAGLTLSGNRKDSKTLDDEAAPTLSRSRLADSETVAGIDASSIKYRTQPVEATNQLPGASSLQSRPPSEPSNENAAEKLKNTTTLSLHQKLVLNATSSHKHSSASNSKHKHSNELSILPKSQTSKKKKAKNMHQRLGEMLKMGKTQSSNAASLTDFLSSL